jgi:hypothetical protein
MTEFIPFVGDLIPVYTLSTLLWISKELRKPERTYNKGQYDYRAKRVVRDLVGTLMRRNA